MRIIPSAIRRSLASATVPRNVTTRPSVTSWISPFDRNAEERFSTSRRSVATFVGATGGTGMSYDVMYCGARRTPMLEAPVPLLVVLLLVEADAFAAFCGVRV